MQFDTKKKKTLKYGGRVCKHVQESTNYLTVNNCNPETQDQLIMEPIQSLLLYMKCMQI